MKTTSHGLICLTLYLVSAAFVSASEPMSDQTRIQGTWSFVSGESNGWQISDRFEEKQISDFKIAFDGKSMTMSGFGAPEYSYEFELKTESDPKAIKITAIKNTVSLPKGAVIEGIYQFSNDQLILCLPNTNMKKRPTEFKAPAGSELSVLTVKRADTIVKD